MTGTLAMKVLTTLNDKFTESEVKKENKSHVHVILISHVYVSIIMSVSNGWKSHFGENIKFDDITDMFNK